jgi:hypothetical protein
VELRLVEKNIWVQMFHLRKGVELLHVQVWATYDTLLLREQSDDHVVHNATPNVHFRAVSHMFHDAMRLLWFPYPNILPVYSTRGMECGLIWKHYVCQVSADSVKHVTGKIVSPWVVLWFQVLQNLHPVRIET